MGTQTPAPRDSSAAAPGQAHCWHRELRGLSSGQGSLTGMLAAASGRKSSPAGREAALPAGTRLSSPHPGSSSRSPRPTLFPPLPTALGAGRGSSPLLLSQPRHRPLPVRTKSSRTRIVSFAAIAVHQRSEREALRARGRGDAGHGAEGRGTEGLG